MAINSKLLTALALVALAWMLSGSLEAKKKQPVKQGAITGTVFQQTGFSLRGATVTLTPHPEDGRTPKKKEIQQTSTDRRGEFGFRIPSGALRYTVTVEADGWETAEKSVESQWDQRVTVNFRLRPATAGEKAK